MKIGLRSIKGGRCFPFSFERIDAIDGIDVFECPVPVRESVIVLRVPSAFATIKGLTGLKGPKGILADDLADSNDSVFAATPTTLHSDDFADCSDIAFAAKKICSKRWSHCPETIVSKGTGTLSVAVGEDLKSTTDV